MCSADWCSSDEVLTIPPPLSATPQGVAPAPSFASSPVTRQRFSPTLNARHPRAHSAVEPPHPMPNWVVKHSSANDTRTAGSRKSRSARGFFLCGSSSAGRALPCQGRCREFESRLPLHFKKAPQETGGPFRLVGYSEIGILRRLGLAEIVSDDGHDGSQTQ